MKYTKLFTIYRVCAMLGVCILIFGIIFLVYVIPAFIKNNVSKRIVLKDGWSMRKSWDELSYSYEFHAYLFNVTNPDEILNGAIPIVKEFGPFIYDVRKDRTDVVDHEEDDTLSYMMKSTFFFNANKSKPLSDEMELTLCHFTVFGIPNRISKIEPTVMRLASKSVDSVFHNPKSPFYKVKAKTFLFDGYETNCVGLEEFFAKVICNSIKEFWWNHRTVIVREDLYSNSAWGWLNDSSEWVGETRINRGIKDISEIGSVVEYNHTNTFATWDDEKCDALVGTDGTMFRPFLSRNDNLHVVYPLMGRSITYHYDSEVKHHGIKCFRYTATIGTELETNPEDKCYCFPRDRCPKNGVYDIWRVTEWPTLVSNPHFYMADPYYRDHVTGLDPKKEEHISYIDVHPLTGTVVSAKFRHQYNGLVMNQPKYRLFKNTSEGVLPLAWYEERFTLPKSRIKKLKKLSVRIAFQKFLAYFFIIIGFLLFGVGVGLEAMNLKQSKSQK